VINRKTKYQSWGSFLKSRRETRFRSAREYCAQVPVGISYPQYSRYESGEQLPSLEQALSWGATLGASPMETVLEWTRCQVGSANETVRAGIDKLLSEVRGIAKASSSTGTAGASAWPTSASERNVPLDDLIVFNRTHLKLFASDPAYRDVFTYINSFGPEWLTPAEIGTALGIARARADEMLGQLHELGVIVMKDGSYRASKRNFYFPDDEDFFELRNINMNHNSSSIMGGLRHADLVEKRAYRGLITRELTEEQVKLLIEGVEQLTGNVVALPETSTPRDVYSLCVVFGKRFSRSYP
jgi:hypothetical protein